MKNKSLNLELINKTAALYCVYNDYEFLEISVNSIWNYVDKIYFFVSYSRYDGKPEDSNDNIKTLSIINNLIKKDPNKVTLIRKDWKDQKLQRNEAISIIQDDGFPYCLVIDADEIYTNGDIQGLLHYGYKNPNVDIFLTQFHTYFKSLKWRIHPFQGSWATTLIKTHVRLENTRGTKKNIYQQKKIPPEHVCWHHPSFVRSDKVIRQKICIEEFEYNAKEGWYQRVWLQWTPDMKDFHTEKPSAFHGVIEIKKENLPECLWDFWDNESDYLKED